MAAEPSSDGVLTAARLVDSFGYDLALAGSVVLVFDHGLVSAKTTTRQQRRSNHPFRRVGELAPGVDIVVAAGPGAPVAAITIELLAAFGARRVIVAGQAGVLTENEVDRIHVVARAESDEGTSAHYSPLLAADAAITQALLAELGNAASVALTTDVPFRHTPQRLAAHRDRADLVDMECAAIFAAANHLELAAAALLTPSDVFGPRGWERLPADNSMALLRRSVEVAARVLAVKTSPVQR